MRMAAERTVAVGIRLLTATLAFVFVSRAFALGEPQIVSLQPGPGSFALAELGRATPIVASDDEWPGVLRAVESFRADIRSVTGVMPERERSGSSVRGEVVLVGTLGHSRLIDGLVAAHKIDVSGIRGQWEAGFTAVVERPLPGVPRAVVVVGSDKRGTIFGLYTLSEQMGVSPWSWWVDVRVPHHEALYVLAGVHPMASPVVKYRGIFLNDEAPALSGWAHEKFGGFNHQFYEHVFELLLRLRANYLWPAMWGNAFNEDDPLDAKLADEYGIVMGTSHHEPMLRAQQEWKRHGKGPWDYATNAPELDRFWAQGIARNKEYESTITIGMRGDGDMAMSPNANIALLEHVVADQRKIIAANEDPKLHNPEIWALYKEVQEYYEKGMRVPDDVTLLWSDDNWGNLRRLPTAEERKRSGGAGIYYHFDYVGDPRSYKWLNTYSITKVREQMHLAVEYGADRVWIVNVGDLKPMEFPIEFFLTMARDPSRWGKDDLEAYTTAWAEREFGPEHAAEIARLISLYTKYNSRRKPEMLEPATYSLTEGHEADRVEAEWKALAADAERVNALLPEDERASFFELVLYPVEACANLGEMYISAGRNRLYAKQGRASANAWADETRRLFEHDADLTRQYHALLDGKWDHMMDQTHIGYTFWNEPPVNAMPAVQLVQTPHARRLGVFAEGNDARVLPGFDSVNRQTRAIELAPIGDEPVRVKVSGSEPWVKLDVSDVTITSDTVVHVGIDWNKAPQASADAVVTVTAEGATPVRIAVHAVRVPAMGQGFIEDAGVVTMDAEHASAMTTDGVTRWEILPGFGLTASGMEAMPVAAGSSSAKGPQTCLDYSFTTLAGGSRTVEAILAPTLPFQPGHGLRYTLQVDDGKVLAVDAWPTLSDVEWRVVVADGVHRVDTPVGELAPGSHELRFCRVDPGVALERLLVFEKRPGEYLGPAESARVSAAKQAAEAHY